MLLVNLEHTREGLDVEVGVQEYGEPYQGYDRRYEDIEGLIVVVDNDVYRLEVYPNEDGGYYLTFAVAGQVVVDEGLACDWDELEADQ